MKRLLAILGLTCTLAACGGTAETSVTCDSVYWDGAIGTCIPKGWHVVDRSGLDQRGVPRDVVVAFQSDTPAGGQFPTVTVTREALSNAVASPDYSAASIQSVKNLPGYEEIDVRDQTIDGQDLSLHIFAAQPRPAEPKTRFYQVSLAKDTTGYTYTAAVPLSVDSALENQLLLILQHATLREPR